MPKTSKARPELAPAGGVAERTAFALDWLTRHATKAALDGMARYAIPADDALGVSMANVQKLAKELGRNHDLALALWATGVYEARLLAAFVDEPERVAPAQMDRWCREFGNWAVCDTACFYLFDRTPHAMKKVAQWSTRRNEIEKRAAFALLACVALHDRRADDDMFRAALDLVERGADDERNFVKKGALWALRGIGHRNAALHREAVALATRLSESPTPSARWIGKTACRELAKAMSRKRPM